MMAGSFSMTRRSVTARESAPALLLGLAFSLTLLSQLAPLQGVALSTGYAICWVSTLVYGVSRGLSSLRLEGFARIFLTAYLVAGVFCCCLFLLTGEGGYVNGFFLLLTKVALVYYAGWTCSPLLNCRGMDLLLWVYVVFAAVYALWVQITYIPTVSIWMGSQTYLYGAKNSFGQVSGMAVLCLLFFLNPKGRLAKGVRWVLIAYLGLMVVLAQCRTALLALFVAALVWLTLRGKLRIAIVATVICTLAVLAVPDLRSYAEHAFLLDKYDGAGLDAFSSGRLGIWARSLSMFLAHPLTGVGDWYVDNMYINCLTNLGVLAGGAVLGLWAYRIALNIRSRPAGNREAWGWEARLRGLVLAATAFYIVESLLEGQPPLGPGTCSFLFWVLCGYLDGRHPAAARAGVSLGPGVRRG